MLPPARLALAIALVLPTATAARAGDLDLIVRNMGGAGVPNAVVSVYPASGSHAPVAGGELTMTQKEIAFAPFVLVVPQGGSVSFPNADTVRHHVYSFSPVHRFELKLYGREEHRVERFDKPGVVPLGCNIHDSMAAFIYVADSRFVAKTDAQGRVRIGGLPGGPAQIRVWQPFAKAPGGVVTKAATLGGDRTADSVTIDMRPSPPGKQDH